MGRDPRPARRRPRPGRCAGRQGLFPHRRGHHRGLPGSRRGDQLHRHARRGIADPARAPGAELQRAPAAPQPESRHGQAPGGIPRPCAGLRPADPRRRRPAGRPVRGAAGEAGGPGHAPRPCPHRHLAARALRRLGGARRRPGRSGLGGGGRGCRGDRGHHAQAPQQPLPAGPPEGSVVEVEARAPHRRRRDDVCPARPREALVLLLGLHVRGLAGGARGWRRAGAGRQGLSRLHRCRTGQARPLRPQQHHQAIRPGARGRPWARGGARAGDRVRRGAALDPAQVGRGDALPRVSRIRWDKPPAEADRIDVLERILARGEREVAPGATLLEKAG